VESKIGRKLRVLILDPEEFEVSREVFMSRPNWKIV
jgi:hypothetical protein